MGVAMMNPDLRRRIKVRMRPDLVIKQQRYGGQTFYIVKDPVGLRYYRFREEELFLLKQFDGKNTLDDIRHEFVDKYRPQRISVGDLEKFVQQLLQTGIATADTPQIGQRLFERYQTRRNEKIKQFFMNVMYLKVPIFDPERLLDRMLPSTYFFFTIPFFLLMIALWTSAGLLVLANWNTFMAKLPSYHEFFTWRNLLYFWATLGVVKVIHEFGHGLSCKRFGGEVHEMGFLFLVFTPALYCNVSDAWMLPNKWHRVVIGAAGIYVELILASLFVWVWWYTEPGLLNTLSLSIVFVCSVSTVVFNGNPLLRFDGYYIFSDWMEIPNLREHANKYLGNLASRIFLGAEAVEDPYLPKEHRWLFVTYAILAYVYRWVVTVGILWFLYTFLKPYKLGSISALLALAALVSMLVMPIRSTIKLLRSRWRTMKVSTFRMFSSITSATAVIAAILLIPFPMRIDAPVILMPKDAVSVYVQAPGLLEGLYVKDGDSVAPGTVLAKLKDPEREMETAKSRLEQQQNLRASLAYRAMGDVTSARVSSLKAEANQRELQQLSEDNQKMQIMAPPEASGTVFSPPKPSEIGSTLKPGQKFCEIGDPKNMEAYIVIEHSDTVLIQSGAKVWLKFAGHVGEILEGSILRLSTNAIDELPPALSNKLGGEVATTTDQARQREIPLFKSYAVQVPIPNESGQWVAGTRGIARIDIGNHSLFWRVSRYLQQTFHFRM